MTCHCRLLMWNNVNSLDTLQQILRCFLRAAGRRDRVDRSLLPSIRRMGVGFLQPLSLSLSPALIRRMVAKFPQLEWYEGSVWGARATHLVAQLDLRAGLHGFPNSGIPPLDLLPEISLIGRKQQGLATIDPILLSSSHCRWGDSTI